MCVLKVHRAVIEDYKKEIKIDNIIVNCNYFLTINVRKFPIVIL